MLKMSNSSIKCEDSDLDHKPDIDVDYDPDYKPDTLANCGTDSRTADATQMDRELSPSSASVRLPVDHTFYKYDNDDSIDIKHEPLRIKIELETHDDLYQDMPDTHVEEICSECDICHKQFFRKDQLLLHIDTCHQNELLELKNENCRSESNMKVHVRTYANYTYDIDNSIDIKDEPLRLKTELETHDLYQDMPGTHVEEICSECDICHKQFFRKDELLLHIRTCNQNELLELKNENCNSESNMKVQLWAHTGEKPFVCDICHKRFSSRSIYKLHIRTHTGERSFECNICHKKFTVSATLKVHMRTHTEERPYECNICHKQFTIDANLKVHMRTHTGEKPYECNICRKQFTINSNLKGHMRTHTGEKPYGCDICHKQFTLITILKVHMRTHTGEKRYQCNICHKRLTSKLILSTHMRTHTGEKPYACNICHNLFSQKHNLARHKRSHIGATTAM